MSADGREQERLTVAVARARRRFLLNQILREATVAATIALLGPILVLVIGQRRSTVPLLVLFAAAGLGVAGRRWWQRRPTAYQVAQVLDARLHTKDQVSTAVHFLDTSGPAALVQRQAALAVAEGANVEAVFPWSAPRSLYALGSVFLVASTLFAIRYFLEKPPRMEKALPTLLAQAFEDEADRSGRRKEGYIQEARQTGDDVGEAFPLTNQEEQNPNIRLQWPDVSSGGTREGPETKDSKEKGDKDSSRSDAEGGDQASSDPSSFGQDQPIQSYEDMLERDSKNGIAPTQAQHGQDNPKDQSGSSNGAENQNSSFLAKLKDAMSNMLSKLQQKSPGGPNQQASAGQSSQGGDDQQGQGDGKGTPGDAQAGGDQATEGEGAESASNQAGKQSGGNSDKAMKGSGGSKSMSGGAAGSEEGDKKTVEAEQLEAMGMLTDLYGRRAANVNGEFTVEAPAGKQSLRTPQTAKQGRHGDAGGEVNRDEIPLAYQAYVKEYFNKIRQNAKAPQPQEPLPPPAASPQPQQPPQP